MTTATPAAATSPPTTQRRSTSRRSTMRPRSPLPVFPRHTETGSSLVDGITNNPSVTFSGTMGDVDGTVTQVQVFNGLTLIGTATLGVGTWSFDHERGPRHLPSAQRNCHRQWYGHDEHDQCDGLHGRHHGSDSAWSADGRRELCWRHNAAEAASGGGTDVIVSLGGMGSAAGDTPRRSIGAVRLSIIRSLLAR